LQKPDDIKAFNTAHAGARFPRISPDARWIAYIRGDSGRDEIYLTRFPSGEGKWQVSNDGGSFATWSPRGDAIIYRNQSRAMMATAVSGTETPRIGPSRKLFDWADGWSPWYAVSNDGPRFVTAAAVQEITYIPSIRIVRHWIAEFTNAPPSAVR
jgi:hypothetical protein